MNKTRGPSFTRAGLKKIIGLIATVGFLLGVGNVVAGELTEHEIKAHLLLNFAKYVNWPPGVLAEPNTPIKIGSIGDDKLGIALATVVEGKAVAGRRVIIQPIHTDDDLGKCQILFISPLDRKRMSQILEKTKAQPVLTVGENDRFMDQGGVINFVKREGRFHLEINVDAARQSKLEISSKLLSVADVVKGK